jgi:hypothetical protein
VHSSIFPEIADLIQISVVSQMDFASIQQFGLNHISGSLEFAMLETMIEAVAMAAWYGSHRHRQCHCQERCTVNRRLTVIPIFIR